MTKELKFLFGLFVSLAFFSSCVSYKPIYAESWERGKHIDTPYFTIYLIGDAGDVDFSKRSSVFGKLKEELDKEDDQSAIVWLGDNIYPVGLAPQGSVYHKEGKERLLSQLSTMSDFKGQKYFVPGNHDWYTYGRIGLRRQELLIDSFLLKTPNPNKQTNFFLPDKGCGDPQVVDLFDSLGLLLMDSHWFLNEKARSGDQSVCAVSNAEEFIEKLESEIKKNKDKSLIVAAHHPPYTYSEHGGKYSFKDYFFPITQIKKWAYLPLPIAGIVFNKVRTQLSDQDVNFHMYKRYRKSIDRILKEKGRSIVASGHEHTLQFIERNNQYYIVSGAGSKKSKVGKGKGSKFAIGEMGYVKVIFKSPKEAVLQFIVPNEFKEFSNVAFEEVIYLK